QALNILDPNHLLEPSSKAKYNCDACMFIFVCEEYLIPAKPTKMDLCHFISVVGQEVKPFNVKIYLPGVLRHFKSSNLRGSAGNILQHCQRFHSWNQKTRSRTNSAYNNLPFNTILGLGFSALHQTGELGGPHQTQLRNSRKSICRPSFSLSICGKAVVYVTP
ncbi:hypothetical protein DFH28DRAFT_896212, partial [Melampsora americana]